MEIREVKNASMKEVRKAIKEFDKKRLFLSVDGIERLSYREVLENETACNGNGEVYRHLDNGDVTCEYMSRPTELLEENVESKLRADLIILLAQKEDYENDGAVYYDELEESQAEFLLDHIKELDEEKAPKDIIEEGNSSVEVVDSGAGEIINTVDGSEKLKTTSEGIEVTGSTLSNDYKIGSSYKVLSDNISKSNSTAHTITITFGTQSDWTSHLVEVIFAGSIGSASRRRGGKAAYSVTTLNSSSTGGAVEIESLGSGVTFSRSLSGNVLTITATTIDLCDNISATVRLTSNR